MWGANSHAVAAVRGRIHGRHPKEENGVRECLGYLAGGLLILTIIFGIVIALATALSYPILIVCIVIVAYLLGRLGLPMLLD